MKECPALVVNAARVVTIRTLGVGGYVQRIAGKEDKGQGLSDGSGNVQARPTSTKLGGWV
jgi:hypothetical protein